MVLDQLYSADWLEKKTGAAFLMGVSYAVLGIVAAMLLFPDNPGIPAIAFTTLLIVPSITKLLSIEANQAARRNKFDLIGLFKDHNDIFRIYIFLFIGIMLAFAFFSIVWPEIATSRIFAQQTGIFENIAGKATAVEGISFMSLLKNNALVLLIFFILSLVYGTGSIFILTWNASVWGVVFGLMARNSALITGTNAFIDFGIMFIEVFPHLILEASAYILAAVSGGILSKATIREKIFSRRFNQILQDGFMMFVIALIVLVFAVIVEIYLPGRIISMIGL